MKKNNYFHFIGLFVGISLLMILNPLSGHGESLPPEKEDILRWAKENITENLSDTDIEIKLIDDSYYSFVFKDSNIQNKSAYLIINYPNRVQEEQIIEYGYGQNVPYQHGIILDKSFHSIDPQETSYSSPMESYWSYQQNRETVYIDAGTGDVLPAITEADKKEHLNMPYLSVESKETDSLLDETLIFDPYYNIDWLIEEQLIDSLSEKETKISLKEGKSIIYIGEKYNQKVKFAYPVIGYKLFDEDTYFALYDFNLNVIKYVHSDYLQLFGGFYLN